MKIRLKVSLSGIGFSYHAGQEVDVEDKVAKQWIEAGVAETVTPALHKRTKSEDIEQGL